jgi:hypothetical protein
MFLLKHGRKANVDKRIALSRTLQRHFVNAPPLDTIARLCEEHWRGECA